MKKRGLSTALAVTLAAALLGGCTGTAGSKETAKTTEATAQPTTAATAQSSGTSEKAKITDEPVTLRFAWWGSDARHEATLNAIKKYQEIHPNVTIEGEYQGYDGYQQKLMTQIAGKTEPDLMQLDYNWYPDLEAQSNIFLDLKGTKTVDLFVYSENVLKNYCSIGDKVIAVPMGINGFGIMINKSFFEKHNLPLDTKWTWEKVVQEGKRIHEENPSDYLLGIESGTSTGGIGPFVVSAYLYSKTGQYWANEDDYTINSSKEDLTSAFTILKDLFDSGAAQPLGEASLFTGQMEQNPKWLNGELGFTIDWSATVGKYKSAVGEENFSVGMPPFAENGDNQNISYKPAMVLAVSSRSPHTDVAADFVDWLMNDPEAVKILGTQRSVPASQKASEILEQANAIDPDIAQMCAFSSENPAPPVPLIQGNTEIADVVKDICEQVVYGQLSPEAAADKFLSDVQAKMAVLKAAK
ncbi:MAG: extracellular solute-binding protein family 1 [Lacrimispora sp.]|jgi:oligogalacturonide transport system substrate-binding protein|nr:extracellular solute-binding protein family 1 [Lacrimispora sp.]